MFLGKAGAYLSEAPLCCSTIVLAPGLACKHLSRLERLARYKNYSLFITLINFEIKKFMTLDPATHQKARVFVPGKPFLA
jgi:hypothetical protein